MISESTSGGEAGTRLRWLLGTAGVLAIALLVVWWPGCRQYPAVTSKESLQLMKLLYAACNTRDPARLSQTEQRLEKAVREGKVTPPEQEAFASILGMARAGDWEGAERAALRFARDQVGVGHPAPESKEETDPRRATKRHDGKTQ
jgi:hypothetical protein